MQSPKGSQPTRLGISDLQTCLEAHLLSDPRFCQIENSKHHRELLGSVRNLASEIGWRVHSIPKLGNKPSGFLRPKLQFSGRAASTLNL